MKHLMLIGMSLALLQLPTAGPATLGPPAALWSAPARADPPPWAPAHGRRRQAIYVYRYYPALEVYFDTGRRVWFWFSVTTGVWVTAAALPLAIVVGPATFVQLEMTTARPYVFHSQVKARYPGGRARGPGGGGGGHGRGKRR